MDADHLLAEIVGLLVPLVFRSHDFELELKREFTAAEEGVSDDVFPFLNAGVGNSVSSVKMFTNNDVSGKCKW